MRPRCPLTNDLLSWQPPRPQVTFPAETMVPRRATLEGRIIGAMKVALEDCGKEREAVAAEMSDYLGSEVTLHMLNAYLSEARDTHKISVSRFAALVHATGDLRLLSILPELFGCAVVPTRYVALIEADLAEQKARELAHFAELKRREAKGGRC